MLRARGMMRGLRFRKNSPSDNILPALNASAVPLRKISVK